MWAASGSIASAVVAFIAAVAAIFAWINARNQLKHQIESSRKLEVRQATAGMIQAIHNLSLQSRDKGRDNEQDRANAYQQSIMFELAAGSTIDQKRFNAAVNWVLKAAELRFIYVDLEDSRLERYKQHFVFIEKLVFHMTESLRAYDQSGGKKDLVEDIAKRFLEVYARPTFHNNKGITRALTSEGNYLKILLEK